MGLPGLQAKRRRSLVASAASSSSAAAAEEVPNALHDTADFLRGLAELLRSVRSVPSALLHVAGESLDEVRMTVLRCVVALVDDVSAFDKVRSRTVTLLKVDLALDVANAAGLVIIAGAVGVGSDLDLGEARRDML